MARSTLPAQNVVFIMRGAFKYMSFFHASGRAGFRAYRAALQLALYVRVNGLEDIRLTSGRTSFQDREQVIGSVAVG